MKTRRPSPLCQSISQGQSHPEDDHDGFVVGALVRSTIDPQLVGRIVSLPDETLDDVTQARVQLTTFPTPFWARWGQHPMPFLVGNLELVTEDTLQRDTQNTRRDTR